MNLKKSGGFSMIKTIESSIKIVSENTLNKVAKALDISPSKYKQAIERFDSMRNYLIKGEYPGSTEEPEVYLQGSFKLGTEIRPYRDSKDADYDIDIVCRLKHEKCEKTPEEIKHQVGDHLKDNGAYEKLLDDEGKRCWTLNYAEEDSIGFHMDILPSVQEEWSAFKKLQWHKNSIAVTNKEKDKSAYNWTTSNPKDFSKWFYDKNQVAFNEVRAVQKNLIFESHRRDGLFRSVKEIPDIHVKTPLQRSIQLLKRHRDVRFSNSRNEKYKPISMIITVLAAKVYKNETSISETLKNLINRFLQHSQQIQSSFRFNKSLADSTYNLITRDSEGKWYIPNPTNYGENFADRWHEDDHARAKAFFQWIKWVHEDFINIEDRFDESYLYKSMNIPSKNLITSSPGTQLMDFDVPHRQNPQSKWPLRITQRVDISASYNKNGFMVYKDSSTKFTLTNGGIVERKKNICFKAETNIPRPYDVYWQVVNTGREAADAYCLRGDFYNSNGESAFELGTKIRREPTVYRGYHWVECFIIKNGVCVARSGEFVIRIV